MQVPPPGMFPRHPNLPPGMRPPFMAPGMPPPMSTGFQMPVAPPNEPSVSMSNPPSSGAPISSVAGQIPGSGPDQVGSVMAPPHGMMPPLGGGQGPTHIFGPDGTPLEGMLNHLDIFLLRCALCLKVFSNRAFLFIDRIFEFILKKMFLSVRSANIACRTSSRLFSSIS